jgi:predicted DNA-binding transcriptional regulator AlpA
MLSMLLCLITCSVWPWYTFLNVTQLTRGISRLIRVQQSANFCTIVSSSIYRPYVMRNKFPLTLTLDTAIFWTSTRPARINQSVYWQSHEWDDRETIVRLLAGTLDFSFLHSVQTGSEPYTAHGWTNTGGSFSEERRYESEADHLSWSSVRLWMRGAVLALPPCLRDMQNKFNLFFSLHIYQVLLSFSIVKYQSTVLLLTLLIYIKSDYLLEEEIRPTDGAEEGFVALSMY